MLGEGTEEMWWFGPASVGQKRATLVTDTRLTLRAPLKLRLRHLK